MTEFDYIKLEKKDGVAYLIMNYPPANALNIGMLNEMEMALEILEEDSTSKVIVLKSVNEKMFSAGADVSLLEKSSQDEMDIFCRRIKNLALTFRKSKKIYIASIEGHCLGGGLELAMSCDLRVAKDSNFRIGLPEINLGLFPGGGGIQLAGRIIGMQKAFRLATFGETLTVSEATEWGLVDYLLPQDRYSERLEDITNKIAQKPSVALGKIKHLIYFTLPLDIEDAFEHEYEIMRELLSTKDFKEGIRAFKEKRSPQFTGQ